MRLGANRARTTSSRATRSSTSMQPIVNSEALQYSGSGSNMFPLQQAVLDYTQHHQPDAGQRFSLGHELLSRRKPTCSRLSTNAGREPDSRPADALPARPVLRRFRAGRQAKRPVRIRHHRWRRRSFHQTAIQVSDTAIWSQGTHTLRIRRSGDPLSQQLHSGHQQRRRGGTDRLHRHLHRQLRGRFLPRPAVLHGLRPGIFGHRGAAQQRHRRIRAGRLAHQPAPDGEHRPALAALHADLRSARPHDQLRHVHAARSNWPGQNGNSRALYNQYNGIANFLPRLGLAWSLDDKTVVRAAFSRSSFQEGTGEFNRLATNAPWNVDLVGQWGGVGTQRREFPPTRSRSTRASRHWAPPARPAHLHNVTSAPASCFAGVRLHATDPNYRPAVSNQWNLSAAAAARQARSRCRRRMSASTPITWRPSTTWARISAARRNSASPGPYLAGNPTLEGRRHRPAAAEHLHRRSRITMRCN